MARAVTAVGRVVTVRRKGLPGTRTLECDGAPVFIGGSSQRRAKGLGVRRMEGGGVHLTARCLARCVTSKDGLRSCTGNIARVLAAAVAGRLAGVSTAGT